MKVLLSWTTGQPGLQACIDKCPTIYVFYMPLNTENTYKLDITLIYFEVLYFIMSQKFNFGEWTPVFNMVVREN